MSSLGRSLPHDSAREHVTGRAVYLDDVPPRHGELFVDVVGSPVAHGRIRRLDVEAAKRVAQVFTAADVPHNLFGPIFHDEELLASEVVRYVGQPVVCVAAESREAVAAAKKLVTLDVEPLPPVLTIDDAIAAKQFIGPTRTIRRGDVAAALASAPLRLTGELTIGGQEHFYLEAQVALAEPGEAGEVTVHSFTQNPSEIQAVVAHCLGLSFAQVVCVCKRMGGGFGGKETQAAQPAILAALVAAKTRRPARCVWGHEQDFRTTGKRHPYQVRYEVGFDDDGMILALRSEFHSNGGFSADLSLAVMERTLLHAENAYYIPHVEFVGTVCRTNLPSNTAFRGFGGPQGVAAMEAVIEDVAATLEYDPHYIRWLNCYGSDVAGFIRAAHAARAAGRVGGELADAVAAYFARSAGRVRGSDKPVNNVTPYGQVLRDNTLPLILETLDCTSNYSDRTDAIEAFNAASRTHLRGIALMPVKFGISFTRRTLNQANALVNVFLDGTVQVSTGGTEMGQGLNTKLRQLVADALGVPVEAVRVMPTSTEKNNNTSPTAASASTDLNGTAAVRAAEAIRKRLADVAANLLTPTGLEGSPDHVEFCAGEVFDRRVPDRQTDFVTVVKAAYEKRVDLGARGFYATPGVDFDRETGQGTPFLYYTNGAAVAEVEIDRFTGALRVMRVDVLMDLGRPINPAIDRGQVIGGFVQGMGWVTTEALVYGHDGELLSDSATTYKIPSASDVPADFRVGLLDNAANRENVYASKAVGEPPLLLAVSVWAAVKQALSSLAPGRPVRLNLPATNEEILKRITELTTAEPTCNGHVPHGSPVGASYD